MITREDILKKYQTSKKTYSSFTEKVVKKIIPEAFPKVVGGININQINYYFLLWMILNVI